MSKLSQLEHIKRLGIPTPDFVGLSYGDFIGRGFITQVDKLTFPVAVRSSFSKEDGKIRSYAGQFLTRLNVSREELEKAIQEVFDSYPQPHGQMVIIQEMLAPQYNGVLFAYRQAAWKLEYAQGLGNALVSGKVEPRSLILPKFQSRDIYWSSLLKIWRPFPKNHSDKKLIPAFIKLAAYAHKILMENPLSAPLGIDIEFIIIQKKAYVLQARPLTTEEEAEELLTSANHKEILPPQPSRMMTAIIAASSKHLFSYYQRLDPSLQTRNFIEISAGMPWINLSALLDTMVAWGLPTSLVCESVGAEDLYRVGPRPYQMLLKWPVFLRVIREQMSVVGRTRRWVRNKQRYLLQVIEKRRIMWRNAPEIAFNNWQTDLQVVYVELVSLMQALTGSMSGPMKLFSKLGWLQHYQDKSESTQLMQAFGKVVGGELPLPQFLKEYGHRGFYESDIGQKRFREYSEEEWDFLISKESRLPLRQPKKVRQSRLISWLTQPFLKIMIAREWLRHHTMRYFDMLRTEIVEQSQARFGEGFDFSAYNPEDLQALLQGESSEEIYQNITYPQVSGWDMDTFLWNHHDRRLPLSFLANGPTKSRESEETGLGIYPGKIKGQIWKVDKAELKNLQLPDFSRIILLTESLDPGWSPFFVKVDGVLSYVGGILSHASIILRESQIPSITRLPRRLDLQQGDWVEMDGTTGEVHKISSPDHE